MVLTALRALCVLLSALCAATHVLETVGVFRRWSHLNGFLVPSSFFRAEGKSRIQCSSVCLGDSECRSFTYEEDRRACYLHRSHRPLPGDSRPGAATFYRKWTHCPQDWDLLNGTLCVKLVSTHATWENAVQGCRDLGADLISVQTEAKVALSRSYLASKSVAFVWTGANDRDMEGQWKWVASGEAANFIWGPHQPDSKAGEDCAAFWNSNHELHDVFCSESLKYLCEVPL